MSSDLYSRLLKLYLQFKDNTDKVLGGIGKTGDSVNVRRAEIQNAKVAAASEPPPDACRCEDRVRKQQKAIDAGRISLARTEASLTYQYTRDTPEDASKGKYVRLAHQHAVREQYGAVADLSAGHLGETQLTPEDYKLALMYADNILGASRDITLSTGTNTAIKEKSVDYEDKRTTASARRSVAMYPTISAIHARKGSPSDEAGPPGPSERDTYDSMSKETWGDPEYRDRINTAVDGSPIMKEVSSLMGDRARMLLKEIQSLDQSNSVLCTMALELLEELEQKNKLSGAYVRANTGYKRGLGDG